MQCDFCKRDENEINEVFAPIIASFEKQIKEFEFQIENIKEDYSREHGFTRDNFEKVKSIKENFLRMKISTIMGDLKNFFDLDSNISLLTNYFSIYRPQIAHEKTLMDLLSLYVNEPTESRLKEARTPIVNGKSILQRYINKILGNNKFYEIDTDVMIPLGVFEFEGNVQDGIQSEINALKQNDTHKTIRLCPYCEFLFKKSKEISEKIKQENRKVTLNVGCHDEKPHPYVVFSGKRN